MLILNDILGFIKTDSGLLARSRPLPVTGLGSAPRISSSRILAALAQLGFMQMAISLGTLVRNKLMAVYLQPHGFGEFTQLTSIAASVHLLAQFGMAVGLARNTAAASDSAERQKQLSSANGMTLLAAGACLAVALPLLFSSAADLILPALGIHPGWMQKALLCGLLLVAPLEVLRNNYQSFLQGLLDLKGLSGKRSAAIAMSTVLAVPLIAFLGAGGACVHSAAAALLAALLLGQRCRTLGYRPLSCGWDKATVLLLSSLGASSVFISFSQSAVETLLRARLISAYGAAENGLYQAALAVSAQITAVVLGSVATFGLAALSSNTEPELIRGRMEDLLHVVLPVAALALSMTALLSRPAFSLLYSPQFQAGTAFLPLLLLANYVQVASWTAAARVLGARLVSYWVWIQVASLTLRFIVTVAAFPVLGPYALPTGFLLAMCWDASAYFTVCRTRLAVRLPGRIFFNFLAGAATIAGAGVLGCFMAPGLAVSALAAAAACAVCALMARRNGSES